MISRNQVIRWPGRHYRRWPRAQLGLALGLAGAIGALAQYFLDPVRGRTRRARARDQACAAATRPVKRLQRRAEQKGSYLRDRARGAVHEMTTAPTPHADDRALTAKVRSEVLGDPRYADYTVNVDTVEGVVSLRGQLRRPDEIRDLVAAVAQVPGVRDVENFLHLPGTTAPNVAGLQEPADMRAPGAGRYRRSP
ncbi:MAG: BON domain-containing protein [Actinomycetota bacterium]|nr:BON domain-containing protein [Actinomycetota bacterium]